MTGEGISSEVGSVFPLGGVGVASASISEVAMFHLGMVGEALIHVLPLIFYKLCEIK